MDKLKTFIFILIIVAVLAGLTTVSVLKRRVTLNDDNVAGNTPGNLFNGGMLSEDEGMVYFSNPYDNNTLYSMDSGEGNIQKLSNSQASSINVAGKYIYYYQADSSGTTGYGTMFRINGLYRMEKNGKNTTCLKRCFVPALSLYGNTIFYQLYDTKLGTNLYRIDINKKNDQQIGKGRIDPCGLVDGQIYYGGFEKEHNLHAIDTTSNSDSTLIHGEFYMPQIVDGYVYYMDIHRDYHLMKMDLYSATATEIVSDRIDSFNVYENVIYYTKSVKEPALMRCSTDGSAQEKVMDGVFEHVNITSQYVYFNTFNQPTPVYHQPTFGPVMPQVFNVPVDIKKPGFFSWITDKLGL